MFYDSLNCGLIGVWMMVAIFVGLKNQQLIRNNAAFYKANFDKPEKVKKRIDCVLRINGYLE